MPHIRGLPNEILLVIAAFLDGNALSAFGISCKNIYDRSQPATPKFNIEYQNSNLLHLAAKTNNVPLAEAMFDYHANVNALFRGKTPIMRALEHSATEVLKLLLKTPGVDINLQNQGLESALWYAIKHGTCRTVLEMAHACPSLVEVGKPADVNGVS